MEFFISCYLIWACAFLAVAFFRAGIGMIIMDTDWILSSWVLIKVALPLLFLINEAWLVRKLVHKIEEWEMKRDYNSNNT